MRIHPALVARCDLADRSDCSACDGAGPKAAASARSTPPRCIAAIDRGVAYLKREQRPRGSWGELPGYDGGVTALCTLAL